MGLCLQGDGNGYENQDGFNWMWENSSYALSFFKNVK